MLATASPQLCSKRTTARQEILHRTFKKNLKTSMIMQVVVVEITIMVFDRNNDSQPSRQHKDPSMDVLAWDF